MVTTIHPLLQKFSKTILHSTGVAFACFCIITATHIPTASAATATLVWQRSTSSSIAGYKLHYGPANQDSYVHTVNVGNRTTFTATNLLDGGRYCFAVTAYDAAGNESDYSNEVIFPSLALVHIYELLLQD